MYSGFSLLDYSKPISSPANSRSCIGSINLIRQLTPFRVIDAVNPALRLDNQTPVLIQSLSTLAIVPLLLGRLDGNSPILTRAGKDLDSLLVAGDFNRDTSCAGICAENGDQGVLRDSGVSWTVDDEAVVVAGAVCPAEALCLLDVLTHQLSAGEVRASIVGAVDV